jgi:ABC-type dipeptide/oligopeptide/nickel transport system permease subunit
MSTRSNSDAGATPVATTGTTGSNLGWKALAARFAQHRLALAGLVFFVLMAVLALLVPLFLGPNYAAATSLDPCHFFQEPCGAHLLGTDEIGRDELAKLLLATRVTMLPAVVAVVLATVIGAAVLAVLARLGSSRFPTLARAFEVLSTPPLILVLLVGVGIVTQQPLMPRAVGYAFTLWVRPDQWGTDLTPSHTLFSFVVLSEVARLVVLLVQSRRGLGLRPAAVAGAAPPLPTILGPAVVTGLWIVGAAICLQPFLYAFGVVSQPPFEPWPVLYQDAVSVASSELRVGNPVLIVLPLLLMLLTVGSANLAGFGLRKALRELASA